MLIGSARVTVLDIPDIQFRYRYRDTASSRVVAEISQVQTGGNGWWGWVAKELATAYIFLLPYVSSHLISSWISCLVWG